MLIHTKVVREPEDSGPPCTESQRNLSIRQQVFIVVTFSFSESAVW